MYQSFCRGQDITETDGSSEGSSSSSDSESDIDFEKYLQELVIHLRMIYSITQ